MEENMSSLTEAMIKLNKVIAMAENTGVGERFWSALAHSQFSFEIIAGIPAHISMIQKMHLSLVGPIDDSTVDLAEWVDSLDPGHISLLEIKPNRKFQEELFSQISKMGISVLELTTIPNSVLIEEDNNIIFRPNSLETTIEHLISDIKIIILQRKFIGDMMLLKQ